MNEAYDIATRNKSGRSGRDKAQRDLKATLHH